MRLEAKFTKRMGSFLLNVDLQAEDEILAILGASGCGKSMTLKCIAGIEKPDRGYIRLGGRVLFDSAQGINLPPQKRRVGYMFQEYALFPNMTVRENVKIACQGGNKSGEGFIRTILKSRGERKYENCILKQFQLLDLADLYPHQLSGGQKQRTAMARMLAAEPDLILLDEPFSALDAQLRWVMEQELKERLAELGRTTVFVSHSRDEVYRLCDSVCTMTAGKTQRKCDVRELFASPITVAEAGISGCRNIASCVRQGDHMVYVPEWDISLSTDSVVGEQTTHVGIRAHYFSREPKVENWNAIRLVEKRVVEEPFEWNIDFRTCTDGPYLHWRVSKEMLQDPEDLGDTLWLDAGHVMLLEP